MKSPESMSHEARVAEIGALLARAVRRYRQKALADSPDVERPCDPTVDAPENNAKEIA